ncbi:unnamed protein product [Prorocentrum cordatum]|uniref:JmjC domain-containing protein n=1 Tax=Prorocentrum cordatum TaxID=2364126 RepID=A0ABN9TAQ4_9DINO|nr:unnamed protein product [Polarella glacialis]
MLLRGLGTDRNEEEAFEWICRAAEQDVPEALYLATVAYSIGVGTAPDEHAALAMCARGAEQGHPELQHRLGVHLATGEGVPRDARRAAQLFEQAAEQGHTAAACNLGVLLAAGGPGLQRSSGEARRRFEAAAAAGDEGARRNLALLEGGGFEASSPQRDPKISLDSAQLSRLRGMLGVLDAMDGLGAGPDLQELVDILQCVEEAAVVDAAEEPWRRQRRAVPRIDAEQAEALQEAMASGAPVLLKGAMPHLSGARVLDFMPTLLHLAGRDGVVYEARGAGPDAAVEERRGPLARVVQEVHGAHAGSSCLMVCGRVLCRECLSELSSPPSCCAAGPLGGALPEALRPVAERYLLLGSGGARGRLCRDPALWCSWSLAVLGRTSWRLLPPGAQVPAAQDGDCWGGATSELDLFAASGGAGPPLAEAAWEATQEMGEVLLVPPGWWQQAAYEDRSLQVVGLHCTEAALPRIAEAACARLGVAAEPGHRPEELLRRAAAEAAGRATPRPVLQRGLLRGQAVANQVCTLVGFPAGSKFANRFLKVVLYPILDLVQVWSGAMDNIAVRVASNNKQLNRVFPEVVAMLTRFLKHVMPMKVSTGQQRKSKYVTSSEGLASESKPEMKKHGVRQSGIERWLGVDYQPEGRRRNVTRDKRMRVARGRWVKERHKLTAQAWRKQFTGIKHAPAVAPSGFDV